MPDELRAHPVVAVDVNAGHLAVAVVAADANVAGVPFTVPPGLAGLPAAARDGRPRNAISVIIATAREQGARAVVIERTGGPGPPADGAGAGSAGHSPASRPRGSATGWCR